MLLPIPEDVLQAQARERTLDLLLSGVGVSAAVASASFAAYMVVSGPLHSAPRRSAPLISMAAGPTHTPRAVSLPESPADVGLAEANGIDFDPTGSISGMPDALARETDPKADARMVLPDFAVRDVFDGTALIEADGTLQMVRPGAVLAGAGTVKSVTRQSGRWVVATTGGLILQRR